MEIEALALNAGVIHVEHGQAPDTKERNRLRKAEARLKATALKKAKEMELWQKLGGVADRSAVSASAKAIAKADASDNDEPPAP